MTYKILQVFAILIALQSFTSAQSLTEITFSDEQMFYDISMFNFYVSRQQTYEYRFTARKNQTVNLYLFQNNVNQYSIHVYDGSDDQATEILTAGKIPANDQLVEQPVPFTSTGETMFIRIRADNSDLNAQVDFQAMATDYAQPSTGCSNLVSTINSKDMSHAFSFVASSPARCYYVIHANDPTNNFMLQQSLQNGFKKIGDNFKIYKGLSTNEKHLLVSTDSIPWSAATDKYMLLHLTESIDLGYYWTFLNQIDVNEGVGPYSYGVFMTNDYYQNGYPNLPDELTQIFVLKRYTPVNSIQVNFLNLMGTSTVTATTVLNNVTSEPIVYQAIDFTAPFNVTFGDCDQVILKYYTNNRYIVTGSGFYFMYSDNSVYKGSTTSSSGKTTQAPVTGTSVQPITNTAKSTPLRSTRQSTQRPSNTVSSAATNKTNAPEPSTKVVTNQPLTSARPFDQSTPSVTAVTPYSITSLPVQSTTKTAVHRTTSAVLVLFISCLFQIL